MLWLPNDRTRKLPDFCLDQTDCKKVLNFCPLCQCERVGCCTYQVQRILDLVFTPYCCGGYTVSCFSQICRQLNGKAEPIHITAGPTDLFNSNKRVDQRVALLFDTAAVLKCFRCASHCSSAKLKKIFSLCEWP